LLILAVLAVFQLNKFYFPDFTFSVLSSLI